MAKKTLQKAGPTFKVSSQKLSTEDLVDWLEAYRALALNTQDSKSKLISIKIPESLLNSFKQKAEAAKIPYQTKIKELMLAWLKEP